MRIVFMGTPSYATEILSGLLEDENFKVVGLFTQADKAVGRKKVLTPPHVKEFLLKNSYDIPIFQPKNLRGDESERQIRELNPDFIVVAAYGQILPKNILDICPCINLHASILPKYRGASPIQAAILNGEKQTGVTSMLMDEGLDTGDILQIAKVNIDKDTRSFELFETLSQVAKDLTIKTLKGFDDITPQKQDDSKHTKCGKISKQDGEVDVLTQSAKFIYRKFCAFSPWPGIYLPNKVKLIDIELKDEKSQNEAGKILHVDKNGFEIATKKGTLHVKEVQPPTKKKMSAYSYMQGLRKKVADRIY